MTQVQSDLVSFFDFAVQRASKEEAETLEDLVDIWRQERERAAVLEDMEAAFEDEAAGRCVPIEEAFEGIRRRLGLGVGK